MSWVNDLASAAGVPAGAATLALAMYAAFTAAEKAARPEALQDIGRILKNPSWSRSVRPSAIIERIFRWTFGERHLSWKCLTRSWIASLVITGVLTVIWFRSLIRDVVVGAPSFSIVPGWLAALTLVSAMPDYAALGKTRLLLRLSRGSLALYLVPITDIVLSVAISVGVLSAFFFLADHYSWKRTWFDMEHEINSTCAWYVSRIQGNSAAPLSAYAIFIVSTLFTSVWAILILLSTAIVKLLTPVHRFTAWFFDVQQHPVQAIGIVAGALVMIGSLIWTVLRVVI
jgi:hypothetical protein